MNREATGGRVGDTDKKNLVLVEERVCEIGSVQHKKMFGCLLRHYLSKKTSNHEIFAASLIDGQAGIVVPFVRIVDDDLNSLTPDGIVLELFEGGECNLDIIFVLSDPDAVHFVFGLFLPEEGEEIFSFFPAADARICMLHLVRFASVYVNRHIVCDLKLLFDFREPVQDKFRCDGFHIGEEFLENETKVLLEFREALFLSNLEIVPFAGLAVEDAVSYFVVELEFLRPGGDVCYIEVMPFAFFRAADFNGDRRLGLMANNEADRPGSPDTLFQFFYVGKDVGRDAEVVFSSGVPGDVHGWSVCSLNDWDVVFLCETAKFLE